MDEPVIPPLTEGAIALHENLLAFMSAGFTRVESLQIVMMILRETIRRSNGPSPENGGGE